MFQPSPHVRSAHLPIVVGILLTLLALGIAFAQNAEATTLAPAEVVSCPDFAAAFLIAGNLAAEDEIEGETYECGIVTVPENYDDPKARTIELLYLRLFSTSPAPYPDPVVHLAGGPGSSGTLELAVSPTIFGNYAFIRQRRDIIAYDQRGTGWSDYLLCPAFDASIAVLLETQPTPELEESLNTLEQIPYFNTAVGRCGIAYVATGTDLAQYNSVSSSKDIVALMGALGYDQYNLIGTSYGTRLAQIAMRVTPERIRSVVLDGTIETTVSNVISTINKRASSYQTIFEACAADEACNAAYPNLSQRFATLLTGLAKNPLSLDAPVAVAPIFLSEGWTVPVVEEIGTQFFVDLPAVVDAGFTVGGVSNSVPRLILAAEEGDVAFITEFLQQGEEPAAGEPPPRVAGNAEEIPYNRPEFETPIRFLLARAQESSGATSTSDRWVSTVLTDLTARLTGGETEATVVKDLIEFALLPTSPTSAELYTDFDDSHLTPEAATEADALVASMTRDELFQTRWAIQDVALSIGNPPQARTSSTGLQYANNCAEDAAFHDQDDIVAYLKTVPYPELLFVPVETFNAFFLDPCRLFPASVVDESVIEPLDSNIPTLLLNGSVDIATPIPWARGTEEMLSNATLVEFANVGHVVTSLDPTGCSGALAASFFDDPARASDLDTSCSQAEPFTFDFVLPE